MPNLEDGKLVLSSQPRSCDECIYAIPPRSYHFEYYGQRPRQPVRLRAICQDCLDAIYAARCIDPDFDWTPGELTDQLKQDFPRGLGSHPVEARDTSDHPKRRSTASPFAKAPGRGVLYRSPGRVGLSRDRGD